jgi:hypothetical protein
MKIILLIILFGAFSLLSRNFSGEGGGLTKGDERQKIIFRDATVTSWEVILLYALLRLLAIAPFLKPLFVNVKTSVLMSNSFFKNGGDILLVGLIGYVIGFFGSYIKRSQIR